MSDIRTEKVVSINFESREYKRGEEVTHKFEARMNLGIDTTFREIVEFQTAAKKITRYALQAIKAGTSFDMYRAVAKYKWTDRKLEAIDFDGWNAVPVYNQIEDSIYFEPDLKYTPEHRDMVINKGDDILKAFAEYIG